MDPGRTAVGTWSGGRFMHFGEPLDDERFLALIRPGGGIDTVLTADTYGQGEADRLLGRAVEGVDRSSFSLVGAVGPRARPAGLRAPWREGDHARRGLRRAVPRRPDRPGRARPPRVPPRRLDRARPGAHRADAPGRRAPRPDDAAAGVRMESQPP